MDSTRFDGLTRTLTSALDRRTAVRGLFAGALAAALGGTALEVDAKRRRRKRRKKKNQTGAQEQPGSGTGAGGGNQDSAGGGNQNSDTGSGGSQTRSPGDFCQYHQQCPHKYLCDAAVNASNSDTTCCGAYDAPCGAPNEDGDDTSPYCCAGYYCAGLRGGSHRVCLPISELP